MEVFKVITMAMASVIGSFFKSDNDVMDPEVRSILSNPEDTKKYMDAIEHLRKYPDEPQKIKFSNNREITLIS